MSRLPPSATTLASRQSCEVRVAQSNHRGDSIGGAHQRWLALVSVESRNTAQNGAHWRLAAPSTRIRAPRLNERSSTATSYGGASSSLRQLFSMSPTPGICGLPSHISDQVSTEWRELRYLRSRLSKLADHLRPELAPVNTTTRSMSRNPNMNWPPPPIA